MPSPTFTGAAEGYVFKMGPKGLGYYQDTASGAAPQSFTAFKAILASLIPPHHMPACASRSSGHRALYCCQRNSRSRAFVAQRKLRLVPLLPGSEAAAAAALASALVPAAQPQIVAVERPPRERLAAQGRPPRPKADAIDPMDPVSIALCL